MTETWNFPHEHDAHCYWDLDQANWVCRPMTGAVIADIDRGEPDRRLRAFPATTVALGGQQSSNEDHVAL